MAAAEVELRNACIALWMGVPRGATVATVRGRRPARRRYGKTSGGIRAPAVAKAGAATVAAADVEPRNARIAPWLGVPRGATAATVRGRRPARRRRGKTGGGIRALAETWPAAATVAAAVLELRIACIAPWLGVPRVATVATARGRRPARRRHGKTGGGVLAPAVVRAGAATVAVAVLERRNACIAPWLGVPRGAAIATVRGRRPARRRHGKTGGGVRAPPVASPGAATVAAADVELRNACIAPWLGVPRGAAIATVRGRRPARRGRGKIGGGLRALAIATGRAATAA
ncbi:hypothetical protein [Burkholderia gladioli]|uniref:hypothetical protein n=1 Tax=Burkholderia gladioli TaxID=28095 RepID=UPI00163EB1D7|nr:hypothetical protein [Burkholderia gladioli]